MSDGVLEALGGLGLFLLGMFVMTSGLKQLAGRSLRATLQHYTRSPTSGAVAGAVTTAVIQSSSATTVTAIGFVGAGLLTFGEALGIIFGANIGTTITGWLVALFGFKVPLGTIAFPIVLGGSLLRMFGRGRWSAVGEAIAGFGVIFVGIELLQTGLVGLESTVTPESFPPNTWFGRLQLIGIGVLFTLVTQSSSAGVAMALASVHAGTISFPQAAAIVIGMDIGTTVTAAMAVVGGGTQVKRTGLAHVVYNCMTGLGAYFLVVLYVDVVERFDESLLETQPEFLLVGFHTLFNALGVIAVLPFADRFATFIERLIPAPEDELTHALGQSLLSDPDAALDVVEITLRDTTDGVASLLLDMWQTGGHQARHDLAMDELDRAVAETRGYALKIGGHEPEGAVATRHQAAFHVLDHLERLLRRLRRHERLLDARRDHELHEEGAPLFAVTNDLIAWLEDTGPAPTHDAERVADDLIAHLRPYRAAVVARVVSGVTDPASIEASLDASRWLARVAVHVWRISLYLEHLAEPQPEGVPAEAEPDI